MEGRPLIYYDLETTGLDDPIRVVQIGALVDDSKVFSIYTLPDKAIEDGATDVNQLYINNNRLMKRNSDGEDSDLDTVELHDCLTKFADFLREHGNGCILVGHRIGYYDNPILRAEANAVNLLETFDNLIYGYIDTWDVFREERAGLKSYKQVELVKLFLNKTYNAHEAIGDVTALKDLVDKEFPDKDVLAKHVRRWNS